MVRVDSIVLKSFGVGLVAGAMFAIPAQADGFQACLGWREGENQPTSSSGVAAYHPALQSVIAVRPVPSGLFEHHEYDGTAWSLVPQATMPRLPPIGVGRAAMVYDAWRTVAVLIGGDAVWTYAGEDWEEGPALPAGSLRNAAAAFDSVRGRSVVFGGVGSGLLNTTLEYDGVEALIVSPVESPPARQRHAMAFDARRGVVVMFGGTAEGSVLLNDLWEYDGVTWTQIPQAPVWPSARSRHAMAFDTRRGVVVMFGGATVNDGSREWWEWDGQTWAHRAAEEVGVPISTNHQLVSLDARGEMVSVWGEVTKTWAASTPQAPWVSEHPMSQSASIGETTTLSVGVGDAGPYNYRWLKNRATMPGEVGPNLVLTSVEESDAAVYECVVTRADFDASCVQTVAGPAALTVGPACIEDLNGDGSVNFADLNAVISVFNTACP